MLNGRRRRNLLSSSIIIGVSRGTLNTHIYMWSKIIELVRKIPDISAIEEEQGITPLNGWVC
jgi:hypothetical protein